MGDCTPLRVVAHLDSPLAGDAPNLDALLVFVSSRIVVGKGAEPGYKVDRRYACPDTSHIPIAMVRREACGLRVPLCTSPILPAPLADVHEHIAKRIGVEHAGLLAPEERRVVTTTNTWTKSYRLPLRTRLVNRVAWLCLGNRREMLKLLKRVPSIGKKIADGYGRVKEWAIDRIDMTTHPCWPWWIDSVAGPVLMRPLPAAWDGLPRGLIGAKRDFGACTDPYWHQDRYGEIVTPC